MPFTFRLDTLLRYRRTVEEQEKGKLQQYAAEVARMRLEMTRILKLQDRDRKHHLDCMKAGVFGSEIHFRLECEAASQMMLTELKRRLDAMEQKCEQQKRVLLHERQKRETIENLREKALAEFCVEQARREQARADELFLTRTCNVNIRDEGARQV